jgi:hypothetical protein
VERRHHNVQTPVCVSNPAMVPCTRTAERRQHKGRGVNPGAGVQPGDRVENNPIPSFSKAAERRQHKGRGVNPGAGVQPGDHVENNPISSFPKAAERRHHKGRGVNPGNGTTRQRLRAPQWCQPCPHHCIRAVERRHHRDRGVNPDMSAVLGMRGLGAMGGVPGDGVKWNLSPTNPGKSSRWPTL